MVPAEYKVINDAILQVAKNRGSTITVYVDNNYSNLSGLLTYLTDRGFTALVDVDVSNNLRRMRIYW